MAIPTVANFDINQIPYEGSPTFRADASYVWSHLPVVIDGLNASIGVMNTQISEVNENTLSASDSANKALVSETAAASSANFKGVWNSATSYTVPSSVSVDGVSYRALQANTNQNPTTATAYWEINLPFTGAIGNINNPLLDLPLKNSLAMKQGVGSVTFTRATTATYVDRYGILKTAAIDQPRFEKEGLLIEGASTNLLTYSNNFANAAWTLGANTTITSTTKTAPDETTTATTLSTTLAGEAVLHRNITSTTEDTYSLFVKGAAGVSGKIAMYDGTVFRETQFTCDGNWHRYEVTLSSTLFVRVYLDSASEIDIYGVQLENLPFASSYIPTTTGTVTREGDLCHFNYNNNSQAGFAESTTIMDYNFLGDIGSSVRYLMYKDVNYRAFVFSYLRSYEGSSIFATTDTPPVNARLGSVYNNIDTTMFINGTLIDSGAGVPEESTAGNIYIGSTNAGTGHMYGHIKNLRIYDKALTPEEMRIA